MTTLAELIDSTPEIAALVQAQNYPAIADALNAPTTVANPHAGETVTTTVPVEITLKGLLAIVPAAEGAAIYSKLPGYVTDLKIAIDQGDRQYMTGLLAIALAGGAISQQTAAALQALLEATTETTTIAPDVISGPSLAAAAGLPFVSPEAVQAVLA